MTQAGAQDPVARIAGVSLHYGQAAALSDVTLDIPAACMVGLIGPDGVGKSSLLSLLAGARAIQRGNVTVLGGDMRMARQREALCPRIAYMPQGLGKNLYPTLSVAENLRFFSGLFGHGTQEQARRIAHLTAGTGLAPFLDRPAGKLSGGMKQKLGLCCALIHDPDLLILDEPTTGVDPLSRAQFWDLIAGIRRQRPHMSVIVATAYMDEANRFDWLVAMDDGQVLATGTPGQLQRRSASDSLEQAFIALLPEAKRRLHQPVSIAPLAAGDDVPVAIEAEGLTMRFGDFTAVDNIGLRIRRGEIFGFLGSNGCGKSTTMKMLTGLLPASAGSARLFGQAVDPRDLATRRRVGYMSQAFSLYGELTVRQNLVLHARLFSVPEAQIEDRVADLAARFGLQGCLDALPEQLPLGIRQRLSLAVAMVHRPELLILDEPTSGVDPVARDMFWQLLADLARRDQVTIFISTHFMNEAARCDRISLMHAGRVLVSAAPAELVRARGAATLEQAFIAYLEDAAAAPSAPASPPAPPPALAAASRPARTGGGTLRQSIMRTLCYTRREALELRRDPVRATLALLGTLILMCIIGYGINLDVDHLSYAVLDRDQSTLSQSYALNLSGSRYFIEQAPLSSYEELDRRMRSGELALALEIPPGFGRDVQRGTPVSVGAWIDGAMPLRAETTRGYMLAAHQDWLQDKALHRLGVRLHAPGAVETRYRYNPDVKSLPAMIPAVIPLLLMMIPAMLAALSVVREKELGSILNLYVTPVRRAEFLLGKQLPYIALGMLNFMLLVLAAQTVFGVPLKGSLAALTLAALLYVVCATGIGLLVSTFTGSQIAALFFTMIGTLIPCVQFAGLINPVSSLEGVGAAIGRIYPASHFLAISRGVFNKALGVADLGGAFATLAIALPLILGLSIAVLKKQEA